MVLSIEQVKSLAPDTSSIKSAEKLAYARMWQNVGQSEHATWGEIKGSGKTLYQVQLDVRDVVPAYRCSCPSRKQPCKHILGLLLLLASEPGSIAIATPPDWVAEWLKKRTQLAERRAKKQETLGDDKKTQARAKDQEKQKRAIERQAKVSDGLQELERWLHDIIRQGLASVQHQPRHYWEHRAARMVDAQASGIARRLRDIANIPSTSTYWAEQVLERLGKLHLIVESYKRIEHLSPDMQADIRSFIGWTQRKEEVRALPGISDHWLILGQHVEEETTIASAYTRIRTQRTWLWGLQHQRAALILNFAQGRQPFDTTLVPGTCLEGELSFYPSAYPLRAIVKTSSSCSTQETNTPFGLLAPSLQTIGYPSITTAMTAYATALAQLPWLNWFLFVLCAVVPVPMHETWMVRDQEGVALPIPSHFQKGWQLLALSGGHRLSLAGEWNGKMFLPLGAWDEQRFVSFGNGGI